MDSFLLAQSADPHDPMPMLVWADHLEERGDEADCDGSGSADKSGLFDVHFFLDGAGAEEGLGLWLYSGGEGKADGF